MSTLGNTKGEASGVSAGAESRWNYRRERRREHGLRLRWLRPDSLITKSNFKILKITPQQILSNSFDPETQSK